MNELRGSSEQSLRGDVAVFDDIRHEPRLNPRRLRLAYRLRQFGLRAYHGVGLLPDFARHRMGPTGPHLPQGDIVPYPQRLEHALRFKMDKDADTVKVCLEKFYFNLHAHTPNVKLNLEFALNAEPLKVRTLRINRANA